MKAVIFDIDGTLADVTHRLHHLPDWTGFFSEMHKDPVIKPIKAVYDAFANTTEEYYMLIVTARPGQYEKVTRKWLIENDLAFNEMYMRKQNDFRKDAIVKAEILQRILDDGYEPILVIDDRPEVVEMWRSYGLTCLQCASDEIKPNHLGKQFLDMMIAPAGSGKSRWVEKNYAPQDIVSTDAIREQYGWGHSYEDLSRTWNYVHSLIKVRLENHIPTVLDATNLKAKDRQKVLNLVPRGQLVKYVVINRDEQDALRDRGWRTEEMILKQRKIFIKEYDNIKNGDNQPNVIVEIKHNNG